MNALKSVAFAAVLAAGFLCAATPAQAGPTKFSGGFGNSFHHGGGFGHGGGRLSGPFVPGHRNRWHDTSHWDYHPGGWVWTGSRRVYVPAHFDYHVDGHWHY